MSENPYQGMAQQFMELWQKQVASVMSDKQFIHAMLDLLKTAQNPEPYAKAAASSQSSRTHDAGDGDVAGVLVSKRSRSSALNCLFRTS